MDKLAEFFRMGGYALYVWPAFTITAVVLGGIVIWSARELKQVRIETYRKARTAPRRRT